MELQTLREKVKEECERCFAPDSLKKTASFKIRNHVLSTVIKNLENILYKKIDIGIESIIDSLNNDLLNNHSLKKEKLKEYLNSTLDGYASSGFKDLFRDGAITREEQRKRIKEKIKIDSRTVKKFINDIGVPDAKTLDFFCVFLQFAGWNNFKFILNRKQKLENCDIDLLSNSDSNKLFSKKRLEIAGCKIIDDDFIEQIKKQKFSMLEFYTAIKGSQWHGVVINCDIQRNEYGKLQNAVLRSFNHKRDFKIAALVYGSGGSGKSTVLRRLCIDIHTNERCLIVWLNDAKEFFTKGLFTIKEFSENNQDKKILVVVEDWYRMFKNKFEMGSDILEMIHKIDNIRIVIGDRIIVGKPYEIYGNDFELFLSLDENEEIISQIVKKYPLWEESAKKLFEERQDFKSTLFLLLYILARINQDKLEDNHINLSDPSIVFKNIVKSDIKFIANKYVGLAKAIYYWGVIYSKYRIYITYETFLEIADYFNGDQQISNFFSRWNINDPSLIKLKSYITKREVEVFDKKRNFILFNHDIFCDLGISKINFEDWEQFGDAIILQLLDIIIKGDNYCACQFLESMLEFETQIFKNDTEKIDFIEQVLIKDGGSYQLKIKIFRANIILQSERWKKFQSNSIQHFLRRADKKTVLIFSNNFFENSYWKNVNFMELQQYCWHMADFEIKQDFADKILLEYDDLFFFNIGIDNLLEYASKEISNEFANFSLQSILWESFGLYELSGCLENASPEITHDFCLERIMINATENPIVDEDFISLIFMFASKESIKAFYEEYFNNDNWKMLDESVIEYCLRYNEKNRTSDFAEKIFTEELKNWRDFSYLFSFLLDFVSEVKAQNFSRNILFDKQIEKIDRNIIFKCLNFVTDKIKQKFCKKILLSEEWMLLDSVIICRCIDNSTPKVRLEFSNLILSENMWQNASNNIVVKCIQTTSSKTKNRFTNYLLTGNKWKTTNDSIVNSCIEFSSEQLQRKFSLELLTGDDWKLCEASTIETCFRYISNEIAKIFCTEVIKQNNPSYNNIREVCFSKNTKIARDRFSEVLKELNRKYGY